MDNPDIITLAVSLQVSGLVLALSLAQPSDKVERVAIRAAMSLSPDLQFTHQSQSLCNVPGQLQFQKTQNQTWAGPPASSSRQHASWVSHGGDVSFCLDFFS